MARITLILGAGVNKEINPGIDVGPELIRNISDRVTGRTTNGEGLCKALASRFPHLNDERRNEFLLHLDNYIRSNSNASIDGFLQEIETFPEYVEQRQDFSDIGLLMIIGHVVGWEGSTTIDRLVNEHAKKETWLSELYRFMHAYIIRKQPSHELNIVTFNYDRILERFLVDCFDEHSIRKFIKTNVFHVYGRIAKLVELEEIYEEEVNLNLGWPNDDFRYLSALTKNIKLIRQSVDTKPIKDVIRNSHKLIFMGYGFDPINNRRLGLDEWKNEFDRNMIFNVYPGPTPNWDFGPRRKLAEEVRSVRIDADIQYSSCKEFLRYALQRQVIENWSQISN